MSNNIIKVCICGSVDDGKSTLVGNILHKTKNISHGNPGEAHQLQRHDGTHNGNKPKFILFQPIHY